MKRNTLVFILAIVFQVILLIMMVVPRWQILANGKTIILETAPYDPYSIFRGYYLDLNYKISNINDLPVEGKLENRKTYYVVLAEENKIWQPKRVTKYFPKDLQAGEICIKGKSRYSRLIYGIEQYYLPEKEREKVEKLVRGKNALVEVKVNELGEAAIVRIRVGEKVIEY